MPSGGARAGAGRPPKPTALKVLHGTLRRSRVNENEPQPVRATADPPFGLDGEALEFWLEYAPKLIELGLLTEVDRPLFATACEQHAVYRRLMAVINKHPFGKRAKEVSPRAYKALQERDRILGRFGFDPASRAKISVPGKPQQDEFEELLARRRKV